MTGWKMNDAVFQADELNDKLRVAPWEGHRHFVYDLLPHIKPGKIVELGSHYGCSLFAFAQSIKDHGLDTALYAVDTWSGDEQAGYYGDEVIETVSRTVSEFFSGINIHLVRKMFHDAVKDFEDGSIDLIHIDGLHTYEAVSEDYRTWLPKLSKDGIILFHDVFSPLEYGSNVFWKEIKGQFPHLELKHSWGLGILFPKGDALYRQLVGENLRDKLLTYEYKALYEFEAIKTRDQAFMITERDKAIASNEMMIRERDKAIEINENMIRERDKSIVSNEAMIRERDQVIKINEAMIQERDRAIQEMQRVISEQSAELAYIRSHKIFFNFKKR